MKKSVIKADKLNILCYVLLAVLPLLILLFQHMTPIFYNNDDVFLKQIASGEYTGTPETHLLHIGYLTGVLISTLYKIVPSFPWYGAFLFACLYGSILLALFPLFQYANTARQKLILTAMSILVMVGFLFSHMLQIQYTTVTAAVCSSSLVNFYLAKEETQTKKYIKQLLPCIILFVISFEIRDKACLMMLPLFFFIGIIRFLQHRKMLKPLLSFAGILVGCIILLWGIEKIAYASPDWKSFDSYNTNRERIVDYSGYPSYEENRELYDALNISYQSYICASTRYQLLLDSNINATFMEKVANAVPERTVSITAITKEFLNRHLTSYADRPLNLMVYVMYVLIMVMAILTRKYKALSDLLAIFLGRMTIWIYLLFLGRSVPRVTQGIYIAELLLLAAIFFYHRLWADAKEKRKKMISLVLTFMIACIVFVTVKWGLPYTKRIQQYNDSQLAYAETYHELRNYFHENEDCFYMLDTNSFSYFTESVFAKTSVSDSNFVLLGSWLANSPWSDKLAQNNNFDSFESAALEKENVFFVFMNTEATGYEYLKDYYEEKHPGTQLIIHDTFTSSAGVEFFILKCQQ